jgi:hypothetical protein
MDRPLQQARTISRADDGAKCKTEEDDGEHHPPTDKQTNLGSPGLGKQFSKTHFPPKLGKEEFSVAPMSPLYFACIAAFAIVAAGDEVKKPAEGNKPAEMRRPIVSQLSPRCFGLRSGNGDRHDPHLPAALH